MIAKLTIFVIRIYQVTLSPLLGPVCRFTPSCSRYTVTCLERFGFFRGGWLGIMRIARCHPWHPGGYDPPPLPEGATPELAEPSGMLDETPPGGPFGALPREAAPESLPQGPSSDGARQNRQLR